MSLRSRWYRLTRKQVRLGGASLDPGETAIFGAYIDRDLLEHAIVVARWTCGGCDRELSKELPAPDAERYGLSIACPYCDPDNVYSRGVV